ncbi:phage major capsid protein [Ancylobacter novellus]|uniref:phage major capsid protein n=1 Tax=Ancylobacter novellus TaxID=921 RepID=UPI00031D03F0|nr:phage major capsid protein [Ancylobacter novellus]
MSDLLAAKITELGDAFNKKAGNLATRLSELEKRSATERDNPDATDVAGADALERAILNAPSIRDLSSTFRGKAVIKLAAENAAITSDNSTVGAGRSAGTSLVPGQRVGGIYGPYRRELVLRDVIGSARTTSSSVEYVRETGFTNNARPVTEGTTKPTSDLTFNMYSAPVRTLAHIFKVSRQMLDDGPALAAYIGRRGTYGLKQVEENQILFGNGTGQNLNGLVPQATAFAPAFMSAAETAFDRINQAISQAEDAEVPVNAIVLNKRDWRKMLGTKAGDERYISGQSPFGLQEPRLWNLPVVATNAMPVGEFLVGAFGEAATIFDRLDVEVAISTENTDDFEKNMATIRVEERLAFAVFRPEAFVTGDLDSVVTSG